MCKKRCLLICISLALCLFVSVYLSVRGFIQFPVYSAVLLYVFTAYAVWCCAAFEMCCISWCFICMFFFLNSNEIFERLNFHLLF